MKITTYAVQITEDNIPQIIEDAAKWSLKVTPQYDLEEAVDFDETCFAILSVNYTTRQATFTTMWGADFQLNWYFDGATHGEIWERIQSI